MLDSKTCLLGTKVPTQPIISPSYKQINQITKLINHQYLIT